MHNRNTLIAVFFACVCSTITLAAVLDASTTGLVPQQSKTGPEPPAAVSSKAWGSAAAMEGDVNAATVTVLGVPGYGWRHGSAPTALGMVAGYYHLQGYAALFDGDAASQTEAVNQGIASQRSSGNPGHYEDYSLPIDGS